MMSFVEPNPMLSPYTPCLQDELDVGEEYVSLQLSAQSPTPSHESDFEMSSMSSPLGSDQSDQVVGFEYDSLSFDDMLGADRDRDLYEYLSETTGVKITPSDQSGDECDVDVESLQGNAIDLNILSNQVNLDNLDITNAINAVNEDQTTSQTRKYIVVKQIEPAVKRANTTKPLKQSISINEFNAESENAVMDKNAKNAIQARINRQKKKAYVQGLEEELSDLKKENGDLKTSRSKLVKYNESLEEEVAYLKNVIANQSALAGLLKNIENSGVCLTSSFKRSAELDHDYEPPSKKRSKKTSAKGHASGGVCLHVDKDNVSLEFCSKCARMAKGDNREKLS